MFRTRAGRSGERDFNGGDGMKKTTLPTQRELARLAAIVFPACTSKALPYPKIKHSFLLRDVSREEESVRVAARLWLHSGEYCEKLLAAINVPDLSTHLTQLWSTAGDEKKADSARRLAEWSDPNKTTDLAGALEWVRRNGTAKLDRALTRSAFEGAWEQCYGKQPALPLPIPITRVVEFLAWRTQQRSAARATRVRTADKSKKKKG